MASNCIMQLASYAEANGYAPALICGDFQHSLRELDSAWVMECSNWADVGFATTCNAAAQPRRIDLILANQPAQRRLVDYELRWDTVFLTRATQRMLLRAGK